MTDTKLAIARSPEASQKQIVNRISIEKGLEVIAEATNGLQLLQLIKSKAPDIILMDISLPLLSGIEVTHYIANFFPRIKIIVYNIHEDGESIITLMTHGAKGFITSKDGTEDIINAIRIVHQGGVFMTAHSALAIQNYLRSRLPEDKCPIALTALEAKLLKGICDGLSSTDLAKLVHKSPRTVEKYRIDLYAKFSVTNKGQLISKVSKWLSVDTVT